MVVSVLEVFCNMIYCNSSQLGLHSLAAIPALGGIVLPACAALIPYRSRVGFLG
jgi:hypothetical protein